MTSPFAIRGVIEGFDGNPWTHEQRLECVRFISARGMNTFVYGPKDDPLVRRRWREPYPDEALARLTELVRTGTDAGVEIVLTRPFSSEQNETPDNPEYSRRPSGFLVTSRLSSNPSALGSRTPTPDQDSNAKTTEPGSEYARVALIT
jgi:hypothetical protein